VLRRLEFVPGKFRLLRRAHKSIAVVERFAMDPVAAPGCDGDVFAAEDQGVDVISQLGWEAQQPRNMLVALGAVRY
jgi:hypothetical protein